MNKREKEKLELKNFLFGVFCGMGVGVFFTLGYLTEKGMQWKI